MSASHAELVPRLREAVSVLECGLTSEPQVYFGLLRDAITALTGQAERPPSVQRLELTPEEEKLTALVREAMAGMAGDFKPFVMYHEALSMATLLVRDCSFYEETPNCNGVALLRDNHDGGHVVGLHFYGRLEGLPALTGQAERVKQLEADCARVRRIGEAAQAAREAAETKVQALEARLVALTEPPQELSGIHADCWYCMKPGFLYRHVRCVP